MGKKVTKTTKKRKFNDPSELKSRIVEMRQEFRSRFSKNPCSAVVANKFPMSIEGEILQDHRELVSDWHVEKKVVAQLMADINQHLPSSAKLSSIQGKDLVFSRYISNVVYTVYLRFSERAIYQYNKINRQNPAKPNLISPQNPLGDSLTRKLIFLLWAAQKLIKSTGDLNIENIELINSLEGSETPFLWRGFAKLINRRLCHNDVAKKDYGIIESFLRSKKTHRLKVKEDYEIPDASDKEVVVECTDNEKKMIGVLAVFLINRLVSSYKYQKQKEGKSFDINKWARDYMSS